MFFGSNSSSGFGGGFGGQPTQQTGGIFGQAQQQPGGFGQPQSTGLFGQSQPMQNQGGSGLFGQSNMGMASTMGATSGFGAGASTSSGLFGGQQSSAFGGGATSGFGGGQSMGMSSASAFGAPQATQGGGGLFGQSNNQSSFGGMQKQFGGAGIQPQDQGFGKPNSVFGGQQSSGLFGASQPQQNSGFGMQPQNSAFGQPQMQTQPFGQMSMQMGQNAGGSTGIYQEQSFYPQQLSSVQFNFQPRQVQEDSDKNKQGTQWNFHCIRVEDKFSRVSSHMLRLYDMQSLRGQQTTNFEFQAAQKFSQAQNQYALSAQLGSALNKKAGGPQQMVQGTLNFGAGSTSSFGQTSQNTLFGGGIQQQNQSGGMFGQSSGGMFGQSSGGMFGQSSGGMFGQQSSGGIFGVSNNQPKPLSVFGQQNQQQPHQQSSSLFGGAQNTQGMGGAWNQSQNNAGTFGMGQPQQTQGIGQGGSSLFGGQQNQNTFGASAQNAMGGGSSLFGGQGQSQQSQTGTSSLFGGAQPQASSSSLFGQPQQQQPSGSLFGGGAQQSSQLGGGSGTTNLFGGSQTPQFNQQQPATSLFGGQQPQPQQSSLFGAKPTGTATGSLFGGAIPAQPTGSSLFGGQPSQQPGGSSLFGAAQQIQTTGALSVAPLQPTQPQIDLYSLQDPHQLQNSFLSKDFPTDNYAKEIEQLRAEFEKKQTARTKEEEVRREKDVYTYGDYEVFQEEAFQKEALRQRAKLQMQMALLQESEAAFKPPKAYAQSVFTMSNRTTAHSTRLSSVEPNNQNSQVLVVSAVFSPSEELEKKWRFEVHKSRKGSDCIKKVVGWLRTEFAYSGEESLVQVSFKHQDCGKWQALEAEVVLSEVFATNQADLKVVILKSGESQLVSENQVAPAEIQPKQPKPEYKLKPFSFEELLKLTVNELEEVQDLTIENEFGSIQFIGKTDVTFVDFADVVTIQQGFAEVYDDERHGRSKPAVGQKLNKPAIITLSNIKVKNGQSVSNKEERLRRQIVENDGEHIKYDGSQWQFKVKHFTKYGEDDDDSDAPMEAEVDQRPDPVESQSQNFVPEQSEKSRDLDAQSMSSIHKLFRTETNQKRLHFIGSPISNDEPKVKLPPLDEELNRKLQKMSISNAQHQDPLSKLLQKIKFHEKEFDKVSANSGNLPSDAETLQWLNKIGVKNTAATSVGRRVPRIAFNPRSASILKPSKNNLTEVKIKQEPCFDLSKVLESHLQKFRHLVAPEPPQLTQLDEIELGRRTQYNWFEDVFFRSILEEASKSVKPASDGFLLDSNALAKFLEDVARSYSRCWSDDKEQNFFVICMLNALFGDPTRELNRLHPKLHEGCECIFRSCHEGALEHSISTMKRRRNAAIKVLETLLLSKHHPICASEQDSDTKKCALEWLEMGNLRNAVHLLRKNFPKEALMLTQCTMPSQIVKERLMAAKTGCSELFDYVLGKRKSNDLYKQVLQELLFKNTALELLPAILSKANVHGHDCLILRLLSLYSRNKESIQRVQSLQGAITASFDGSDLSIKWLVQLTLARASLQQKQSSEKLLPDTFEWHLPSEVLTTTTCNFVSQLQQQGNPVFAALVAATIKNDSLRSHLLFSIAQQNPQTLSKIAAQINIPVRMQDSVRALASSKSQCWEQWLRAGNYRAAEIAYSTHVLPGLLRIVPLEHLRQLWCLGELRFPQGLQHQAEKQLNLIKKEFSCVEEWNTTTGGLYLRAVTASKLFRKHDQDFHALLKECINVFQRANEDTQAHSFVRLLMEELILALRATLKSSDDVDLVFSAAPSRRLNVQNYSHIVLS